MVIAALPLPFSPIVVFSVALFLRSFRDEGGKSPYYRKSSFSNNATEALHAATSLPFSLARSLPPSFPSPSSFPSLSPLPFFRLFFVFSLARHDDAQENRSSKLR